MRAPLVLAPTRRDAADVGVVAAGGDEEDDAARVEYGRHAVGEGARCNNRRR